MTRAGRGAGASSPLAPTSAIVAGLLHVLFNLTRGLGDGLIRSLHARQGGVDMSPQDRLDRKPFRRPRAPLRRRGQRVRHRLEERERLVHLGVQQHRLAERDAAAYRIGLLHLRAGGPQDELVCPALVRAALGNRQQPVPDQDRKSTRLNSSHVKISYAVFCLKKKKNYTFLEQIPSNNYFILFPFLLPISCSSLFH